MSGTQYPVIRIGVSLSDDAGERGDHDDMMVSVDLKVLQLICSRLCHDLAGPVGAVNNGIELVAELGEADAEAMALIGESARETARRLQYHRVALGFSSGAANSRREIHGLAANYFSNGRIVLDWLPGESEAALALTDGEGKLLLNLFLLAAEALPRGGAIGVHWPESPDGSDFVVTARGDDARVTAEMRTAFDAGTGVDDLTARSAQGYFTARLAESMAATLTLDDSRSGEIALSARMA